MAASADSAGINFTLLSITGPNGTLTEGEQGDFLTEHFDPTGLPEFRPKVALVPGLYTVTFRLPFASEGPADFNSVKQYSTDLCYLTPSPPAIESHSSTWPHIHY